jgi:5-methylcytosine-specific restriction protein A
MATHTFVVGHEYRRRTDIHGVYDGQRQGGISTPSAHPLIFIFTGESGSTYGYSDRFTEDGVYLYTGEGQKGNQRMASGNLAIRDHQIRGKALLVFSDLGNGKVRFMGEATSLGYHLEDRPDKTGTYRKVFVFELGFEPDSAETISGGPDGGDVPDISGRGLWKMPLDQVRSLALKPQAGNAPPEKKKRLLRARSEAVKVYVLRRAAGTCEGCVAPAPFLTPKKRPYLEPHHLRRLADGGPDHPKWVIALCPTCHCRAHYASDGKTFNESLMARMATLEP